MPDLVAEPRDSPMAAVSMRRDRFFGWRIQPSSRERSVLEDLAVLTAEHGCSWRAAQALFTPINEEATHVA
jgi:hypothetical protein